MIDLGAWFDERRGLPMGDTEDDFEQDSRRDDR